MSDTCFIPKNMNGRACGAGFVREAVTFIFSPDGANEITYATLAAMTSAQVTTDINNADPLKRLLPINDIEDYAPESADSKKQEYKSGRKAFIAKGVVNYKGIMASGDPVLVENYLQLNNGAYRAFIVGTTGFNYETDSATKLIVRGLKVSKGSFDAKYMPSDGDANVEQCEVSFDIDKDTDWSLFRYASYDDLGFNLADVAAPLIPIDSATVSGEATTGFTLVLKDERGNPITGLDSTSDFVITNVTATGTEASTSTESPLGTYTVVYDSAVTAADVLSVAVSVDGFDAYSISPIAVTTPS